MILISDHAARIMLSAHRTPSRPKMAPTPMTPASVNARLARGEFRSTRATRR